LVISHILSPHKNLGYSAPAIFRDFQGLLAPRAAIFNGTHIYNCGTSPAPRSQATNWVRGRKSVVLLAPLIIFSIANRLIVFLLALFMLSVLFAERAIFGNREPVGVVTLILITVVVAVLAFRTLKSYLGSHF